MSRVFIPQRPHRRDHTTGQLVPVHDLTTAKPFGELTFLLSPTAAPWVPDPIIRDLWDGLQEFREDDHLLMIGNPIIIGWATTIACNITDGSLSFLQWNGKRGEYFQLKAKLWEKESE